MTSDEIYIKRKETGKLHCGVTPWFEFFSMHELYNCWGQKNPSAVAVKIGIIYKFDPDSRKSQKVFYNRWYCGLTAFNSNAILYYYILS